MVELQRGMVGEHGHVFLLEPRPFARGSKTPDFANTIPAFLAFMAVAFAFFDFPFFLFMAREGGTKGRRVGGGRGQANNVCTLNESGTDLAFVLP